MGKRQALWVVVLSLAALATLSCRAKKKSPQAFTRESVLEKLRAEHPDVSLPKDELPNGVSARENVAYLQRDGLKLALDLYVPTGYARKPAVLVVHGGGWETGDRTMERPFAKRLAAAGFVAVPVSYGLGEDGRFPKALFDLKHAVRWLRENAERYAIEPSQVGIVGGSAGGHLAALVGATNGIPRFEGDGEPKQSSDVQAVVDIDGLADFTGPALREKERSDPGAPTRFLGGGFDAHADVWRDASPITHVSAKSAPTLFIESGAPRPILPGRAEMREKLRAAGVDTDVLGMQGAPHPFWLVNPWFEPTLDATVTFLEKHLTPD